MFALRVFEDVGGREADVFQQTVRLFVLVVCFRAKACDDIRREYNLRATRQDLFNQLAIFGAGIGSIHHRQNPIVTCLCWQMDMLANLRMLGDSIEQLLRKAVSVSHSINRNLDTELPSVSSKFKVQSPKLVC